MNLNITSLYVSKNNGIIRKKAAHQPYKLPQRG